VQPAGNSSRTVPPTTRQPFLREAIEFCQPPGIGLLVVVEEGDPPAAGLADAAVAGRDDSFLGFECAANAKPEKQLPADDFVRIVDRGVVRPRRSRT
jgi:hypothetical protein